MVYVKCYLEDCPECYYDEEQEVYKCKVYSNMEVDEYTDCEEEEEQ